MSRWPWVSREHHDETRRILEQRVAELDKERRELLDRLLGGAVPDRRVQVARVEDDLVMPVRTEVPEGQGEAVSFTTPFDGMLKRFDRQYPKGQIPERYKARTN